MDAQEDLDSMHSDKRCRCAGKHLNLFVPQYLPLYSLKTLTPTVGDKLNYPHFAKLKTEVNKLSKVSKVLRDSKVCGTAKIL